MKKSIFIIISLISFILLCSFAPQTTEPVKFSWQFILTIVVSVVAGIYEILVRLIPTVGNYSWIAKIIDILKWLSDFLNRKKK